MFAEAFTPASKVCPWKVKVRFRVVVRELLIGKIPTRKMVLPLKTPVKFSGERRIAREPKVSAQVERTGYRSCSLCLKRARGIGKPPEASQLDLVGVEISAIVGSTNPRCVYQEKNKCSDDRLRFIEVIIFGVLGSLSREFQRQSLVCQLIHPDTLGN
jgi:hypothetical protein